MEKILSALDEIEKIANAYGISNDNILKFAHYLDKKQIPVWIRHVLIPTITDSDEQLTAVRKIIDSLSNVQRVEILPYHGLGIHKYESLNIEYKFKDILEPTIEQIDHAKHVIGAK